MLKKSFFIFFLFFFIFSLSPIFADFNSLSQEYTQMLSANNSASTEYKIAKNTYETYYTLSSLTQVLQKSKTHLQTRDNLIIKHFELLSSKLDESNIDSSQKDSLKQILSSEIVFFTNHLTLIQSISTINDINNVSQKAESEFVLANIKSKQIQGNILISKVNATLIPYTYLLEAITNQIIESKNNKDKDQTTIDKLERWLVEVKNKKILAENNISQNLNSLNDLSKSNAQNVEKNFDEIRINIIQGHLYLKEGTSFMKEILNEIKYQ
jgi:hypothetical protein